MKSNDANRKIIFFSEETNVPDFAYQSYENVEYIVCSEDVKFGPFTFMNCDNLKKIILLGERTKIETEEFSFTDRNYIPKEIGVLQMFGARLADVMVYGDYSGADFGAANRVPKQIMKRIYKNDDVEMMDRFVDLFFKEGDKIELDYEIARALKSNEMEKIELLDQLGVNFSNNCPFEICLSDFDKHKEAQEFLISKGMWRRRWRPDLPF